MSEILDKRQTTVDKPEFKTRRQDWSWITILYIVWGVTGTAVATYAIVVYIQAVASGRASIPPYVMIAFWSALVILFQQVGTYVQTHQVSRHSDENNRKVSNKIETLQQKVEDGLGRHVGEVAAPIVAEKVVEVIKHDPDLSNGTTNNH